MKGEDCRFAILQFLYKKEKASFEEIMRGSEAARRTTNNYLRDLYNEIPRLVDKEYGKRGKYYLTEDGQAEAEKQMRLKGIVLDLEKLPSYQLKVLKEKLEEAKGKTAYLEAVLKDFGHPLMTKREAIKLFNVLASILENEDFQQVSMKLGLESLTLKFPGLPGHFKFKIPSPKRHYKNGG